MDYKRKVRRQYLLAEVKIRRHGASQWIKSVLMNISRGGVALYCAEKLKKGDRLEIKIVYLERGRLKEVGEVPGDVRWVRRIGMHYGAGIMFSEKISQETHPALMRCLRYANSGR